MKFQIIQKIEKGRNYKVKCYYNNQNVDLIMNGKHERKSRYDFDEEVARRLLEKEGEPVEHQSFADGVEVKEYDLDKNMSEEVLEEKLRNELGLEEDKHVESWKNQVWEKQGLQKQKNFLNRWVERKS